MYPFLCISYYPLNVSFCCAFTLLITSTLIVILTIQQFQILPFINLQVCMHYYTLSICINLLVLYIFPRYRKYYNRIYKMKKKNDLITFDNNRLYLIKKIFGIIRFHHLITGSHLKKRNGLSLKIFECFTLECLFAFP